MKDFFAKLLAWKYGKAALWTAAGVVVAAVAIVIVLCAAGPKEDSKPTAPTGSSSMDGTNPTGGNADNGGSTDNGGTTDNGNNTVGGDNTGNNDNTVGGGNDNSIATRPTEPENDNTNSDAPPAPEGTVNQMEKVTAIKTSSAGGAITAHPGGRITYTISITNNNKDAIGVTVTDTLPEGTSLVRGCDSVSGKNLSWKVNSIAAGATHKIIYTVKPEYTIQQVRDSKTDIIIKNTAAKVQDKAVSAPAKDIWVLETFNDTDCRRMEMAINSLVTANLNITNTSGVKFSAATLVSQIYNVGFSKGISIYSAPKTLQNIFDVPGNANADADVASKINSMLDMLVPGLYGGTKFPVSKDNLFRGNRAESVTFADLISGDIVYMGKGTSEKMYIVCGNTLVDLGTDYLVAGIDPATVIPNLTTSDRYAVIRPSINLATSFSLENDEYFNDYDKQAYTELEKALIATAESYLLRGDRTQYTDDMSGKNLYRWETLTRQPEDYTVDQYGYTNCAGFTHDVHWATYGYSMKAGSTVLNTTTNLINSASNGWNANTMTGTYKSSIFYYVCPTTKDAAGNVKSTLTDAEKDAIYKQYISLLRPGDLIVYRYYGNSAGHVMLYIGNGLIIHSTGGNFPSGKTMDSHEATVRFMNVDDLFDEYVNPTRYFFHQDRFAIVRPQNLTTPKITENAKNRVANMQGIVAEKVSSTAMGRTVNPGDEITYTFYVFNTNNTAKIVAIKDVLSQYVTFVSATNSGSVSGSNISWNLNVPAHTRISVSYKVKVNAGVATYTAIDGSKATINGVAHKCLDTYVANTLTAAQQQTLVNAVNTVRGMNRTGMDTIQVANLIYKTAFGVDHIFGEQVDSLGKLIGNYSGDATKQNVGVFNDTSYWSDNSFVSLMDSNTSKGAMMVAPGMYGGQKVYSSKSAGETYNRYLNLADNPLRSRYFWEKDLVVGDLFFMKSSSATYFYIYVGNDTLVNLTNMQTYPAREWLQRTPSGWNYYAVLRPSIVWENI